MRYKIHRFARRFGLDVRRFSPSNLPIWERRMRLFEQSGVTLVLDVGASTGQYARNLRAAGYRGRIVSFEPVAAAFAQLSHSADSDEHWDARNLALGDSDGSRTMDVARDLESSSLLKQEPRYATIGEGHQTVGTETVETARLDFIADGLIEPGATHLKIDVQGYELAVLRGASETLPDLRSVEAELSLVPLYAGQPLFKEVAQFLENAGLALVGIEPVLADPASGETWQVDGYFLRR